MIGAVEKTRRKKRVQFLAENPNESLMIGFSKTSIKM